MVYGKKNVGLDRFAKSKTNKKNTCFFYKTDLIEFSRWFEQPNNKRNQNINNIHHIQQIIKKSWNTKKLHGLKLSNSVDRSICMIEWMNVVATLIDSLSLITLNVLVSSRKTRLVILIKKWITKMAWHTVWMWAKREKSKQHINNGAHSMVKTNNNTFKS